MAEETEVTRIALESLGCKLNQAETELLSRQLIEAGYRLVPSVDEADIYILNTCTVTNVADRKSRQRLRLAHRRNPAACLVVTGCYAEQAPQELAQVEGVNLVFGNQQKPDLLRLLAESGCLHRPASLAVMANHYDRQRTRAFIKVQDGCRNFCAYCIVPLVRRVEISVPVDQILGEVNQRVRDGYQEVVLTGTEIGSYHCDCADLSGLLKRILAETVVTRLRLSSLQPQEISPELVQMWRSQRLCPHFHLSLQSGSDSVLKRMKRRYITSDYRRAVSLIREVVPEAAITTDVIVGFPGETNTEFQDSYQFCRETGFARIHVFPYSPRPGTEAALMPNAVTDKIKKQRSKMVLSLAEESARNFCKCFLGRAAEVLWEKRSGGIWSGLTGNYIKVYARSSEDLTNKLLPAKLVGLYQDGVWGELL